MGKLSLVILLLAACGGDEPSDLVQRREAPLWMAEADLPGCEGALAASGVELLQHPLDRELLVVVSNDQPTCIGSRSSLVGLTHGGPSAGGPIPLVREPNREGESDDDPIPLVRESDGTGDADAEDAGDAEGEAGGAPLPMELAQQSPASDDPIPLVRPRGTQLGNHAIPLLPNQ